MRCFLVLIFCVLQTSASFAQQIELNETVAIKEMAEAWHAQNRTTTRLEGWRIQLASSTDRFEVQAAKERFVAAHPSISVDWYQEKPYYKLKAGAFKHSWEARRLIGQLTSEFQGAYPVLYKKIKPADFLPILTE
jgi:hypothetical protein